MVDGGYDSGKEYLFNSANIILIFLFHPHSSPSPPTIDSLSHYSRFSLYPRCPYNNVVKVESGRAASGTELDPDMSLFHSSHRPLERGLEPKVPLSLDMAR